MEPSTQADWVSYATKYGVPSFLAVALYWIAPKVWNFLSARFGIAQQSNDLAQAGLGGVTDVVTTLRTQIADLTMQFKDVEQKLKDMSATVDKAIQDKVLAQQDAAKARSDLYILGLYAERLCAQLKALGVTPVSQ
jgi:predicted  nucleic acid-binding Zn-ribbon protein